MRTPVDDNDLLDTVDLESKQINFEDSRGDYEGKEIKYVKGVNPEKLKRDGIRCSWSILSTRFQTFSGFRNSPVFPIILHLKTLEIEGCNSCECGSFEVYQRKHESYKPPTLIKRLCGSSLPEKIISETENVFVRFHVNDNTTKRTKLKFSYSLKDSSC